MTIGRPPAIAFSCSCAIIISRLTMASLLPAAKPTEMRMSLRVFHAEGSTLTHCPRRRTTSFWWPVLSTSSCAIENSSSIPEAKIRAICSTRWAAIVESCWIPEAVLLSVFWSEPWKYRLTPVRPSVICSMNPSASIAAGNTNGVVTGRKDAPGGPSTRMRCPGREVSTSSRLTVFLSNAMAGLFAKYRLSSAWRRIALLMR